MAGLVTNLILLQGAQEVFILEFLQNHNVFYKYFYSLCDILEKLVQSKDVVLLHHCLSLTMGSCLRLLGLLRTRPSERSYGWIYELHGWRTASLGSVCVY